ncbi:uncharacterized protein LOC124703944 [Lolium rigidum]|uniref:uncharacterized protein LOC124703944 n=1 Tax=Lolium rigidum TaxID=89674 RepID=UPI001F5CFC31|nr:uncharacterized protein LOC124703944 [Lolium rigidum]
MAHLSLPPDVASGVEESKVCLALGAASAGLLGLRRLRRSRQGSIHINTRFVHSVQICSLTNRSLPQRRCPVRRRHHDTHHRFVHNNDVRALYCIFEGGMPDGRLAWGFGMIYSDDTQLQLGGCHRAPQTACSTVQI